MWKGEKWDKKIRLGNSNWGETIKHFHVKLRSKDYISCSYSQFLNGSDLNKTGFQKAILVEGIYRYR